MHYCLHKNFPNYFSRKLAHAVDACKLSSMGCLQSLAIILLANGYFSSTLAANRSETTELSIFKQEDAMPCSNHTLNISACPPWSVCNVTRNKCHCSMEHLGTVHCGRKFTQVASCHCLTYSKKEGEYKLGKCIYNCISTKSHIYSEVPSDPDELNIAMCSRLNRNGTLCGQCLNEHYPPVYSYYMDCIKCPNVHKNWWKFILVAFLPLTAFYCIVLLCKVRITPVYMYAFVFYAQGVTTPLFLRGLMLAEDKHKWVVLLTKILTSIYGIWNLDFFRAVYGKICLNLDTLEAQALEYCIALYPFLLILLTCIWIKIYDLNIGWIVFICKPFRFLLNAFNRNWDTTTSLIDAYALFFILSLTKIIYVSFDLLIPTQVYTLNQDTGTKSIYWALYLDGSKDYFGREHFPFGLLAVLMMTIFVVLPILLLCFFPCSCFQRLLSRLHLNVAPLHHFVEKFQGYFQNGREAGTRDYRYFSIFYKVLSLLMFTLYAVTEGATYYPLAAGVMIVAAGIYATVRPYKQIYSNYTKINVIFLLLIAFQYAMIAGAGVASIRENNLVHMFYLLAFGAGVVPLVYVSVLTLCRMKKRIKCKCFSLKKFLVHQRMGYDQFSQENSPLFNSTPS